MGMVQCKDGPPTFYIGNCLPFNDGIVSSAAFFVLSCKPIFYCRFKRIDVYIL